ncbi:hypothetical protein [Dyadobacter fanqingshengii]|uniref:Uncharacterized protein n=1 Tax=Dyadobacter fanqingshengii TaxID=2906443 RepID=A0A9X1TAW2_9BACT|nr:hypothetical protein [Dyadobacter fanqingshengii]MCF0041374.1 hypothetical protein [Dyadobacter fanqingshengii]USJ36905.1 hypothetical protein NFI81_03830 [Dyadobacter fanqingshengii]
MSTENKSRLISVKYPCPVRRVTIQWNGQEWKIGKQVLVPSMTLPAPDPLPAEEQSLGFWIEAADGQGGIYQREVMPDPLLGMEQFAKGGEMTRINHPPHDIALEILVPDMAGLSEIHLVSNQKPREGAAASGIKRTVLALPKETGGDVPDHPGGGHQH